VSQLVAGKLLAISLIAVWCLNRAVKTWN